MTVQAITTPAGWIVEGIAGECVCNGDSPPEPDCRGIGPHLPSELTDAIGQPCETCDQRAEELHDAYEWAATIEGWETQAKSRKPWSDVPPANKATMIRALNRVWPCLACVVAGYPTGLASVELKLDCQRCGHSPDWHTLRDEQDVGPTDPGARFKCYGHDRNDCEFYTDRAGERQIVETCDCPDFIGQVTVRVISDKVLPIVDELPKAYSGVECIEAVTTARWWPAWDGALEWDDGRDIDIGPDPAQHIGRYLVIGRQVDS